MVIYELFPRPADEVGFYATIDGAKAAAQECLNSFLSDLNQELSTNGGDGWFPLATGLEWAETEDYWGSPITYATYCKDWWGTEEQSSDNSRFIIRERVVGN